MKATIITVLLLSLMLVAGAAADEGPFPAGQRLTMELEAVPIATVLNMIASQNNLNLVVSGAVEGDVTLRLQDVDIESALNAILAPNGYNYFVTDNVIVVKPVESDAIGELHSMVVKLKYVEPLTAKKVLEPTKTAKGSIVVLDKVDEGQAGSDKYRANRIMITDLPQAIERMAALIEEIDQPERLISIEVKIIETKVDAKTKLGIAWPTQISASLGAGRREISESSTTGEGTVSSATTFENAAGVYDPETGDWTWGTLSVAELRATLDILNQSGNSKLISDPHLITVENHQAEINVQTVIPIPTINRFTEGAAIQDILTFYDEEIGISLEVTPRVNEAGRITLDVHPKVEDIIGYAGPQDNQKPITASRSVRTRITVDDGETAVLGGLLKEGEIKTVRKVPLLGYIPILGKLLFTNTSTEKTTTDLIILITPKIMP